MQIRGSRAARGPIVTDKPLLQRGIERYFSAIADTFYDRFTVRTMFPLLGGDLHALIAEQGRRAVMTAAGGPILDMPVGTAYFTAAVARDHPGLVVGSDLAEGMVVKAREVARAAGLDNLSIVRGDAHALPFSDGSFAAVLCVNGLPVIPDLPATIAELARVLAPGGTLYVCAITLPVSRLVRPGSSLPTFMRAGRDLVVELERAGLVVTRARRARLAKLLEASKPQR